MNIFLLIANTIDIKNAIIGRMEIFMKKIILTALIICIGSCLASCKTNTNNFPNNMTNSQSSSSGTLNYGRTNGKVTDKNGIIGDNDDFLANNPVETIGDAGKAIGDKTKDTVRNIADNLEGNASKNTTR